VPESIFTEDEYNQFGIFAFTPVIEPYVSENCFIPKDPILMGREATWAQDIPCIIGCASQEGIMTHFSKRDEKYINLLQNARYFTPSRELNLSVDSEKALKYGTVLKELYYGKFQPTMKNIEKFLQYAGDRHIWHGTYNAILSRKNSTNYVFRFDALTNLNFFKRLSGFEFAGASHADTMMYLLSR
jgi:hypothetical protein